MAFPKPVQDQGRQTPSLEWERGAWNPNHGLSIYWHLIAFGRGQFSLMVWTLAPGFILQAPGPGVVGQHQLDSLGYDKGGGKDAEEEEEATAGGEDNETTEIEGVVRWESRLDLGGVGRGGDYDNTDSLPLWSPQDYSPNELSPLFCIIWQLLWECGFAILHKDIARPAQI